MIGGAAEYRVTPLGRLDALAYGRFWRSYYAVLRYDTQCTCISNRLVSGVIKEVIEK